MTKEEVIKFLERKLKDEEGRIGIELSTDGDSGGHASIYSRFIYDYDTGDFNGDPLVYIKTRSGSRAKLSEITEGATGYTISELQSRYGIPTQLIPLMEEIYKSLDVLLVDEELTNEEDILSKEYSSKLHPKDRCYTEDIKIYSILKKSTKEIQDLFFNYASELYEKIYNDDEIEGAYEIRGVSKSDVIKMVEKMLK
jgi:hypothetical protein